MKADETRGLVMEKSEKNRFDSVDVKIMVALNNCYHTLDSLVENLKLPKLRVSLSLQRLIDEDLIHKEERLISGTCFSDVYYILRGNYDISGYISDDDKLQLLKLMLNKAIDERPEQLNIFCSSVKLRSSDVQSINAILQRAQNEINDMETPESLDSYNFFFIVDKESAT